MSDEVEPNDGDEVATVLRARRHVHGKIDPDTDVDRYRIDVTQAGALSVMVDGHDALDPVLEIEDASGTVIARSDRGGARIREGVPNLGVTPGRYTAVRDREEAAAAGGQEAAEPAPGARAGAAGRRTVRDHRGHGRAGGRVRARARRRSRRGQRPDRRRYRQRLPRLVRRCRRLEDLGRGAVGQERDRRRAHRRSRASRWRSRSPTASASRSSPARARAARRWWCAASCRPCRRAPRRSTT